MPAEPIVRRPTTGRPRPRTERSTSRPATPSPAVTIVVPTLNEADNILALLDHVDRTMSSDLPDQPYEVVVVDDDSADGTWRLAQDRAAEDHRVRVIRRVGRRGLSSAVLAGMAVARGDVLVVIDADLQHDERCIPALVRAVSDGADVALGSREVDGGGYGAFGRRRLAISRVGAVLARWAIGVEVADPMSGFFAVSRDRYEALSGGLNPRGFKIMLEFLARGPEPVVAEVGYLFRQRAGGATKFDVSVVVAFVVSVVELGVARRLGRRRTMG
jgi:dolichol-phosphate mannosyltransferase